MRPSRPVNPQVEGMLTGISLRAQSDRTLKAVYALWKELRQPPTKEPTHVQKKA